MPRCSRSSTRRRGSREAMRTVTESELSPVAQEAEVSQARILAKRRRSLRRRGPCALSGRVPSGAVNDAELTTRGALRLNAYEMAFRRAVPREQRKLGAWIHACRFLTSAARPLMTTLHASGPSGSYPSTSKATCGFARIVDNLEPCPVRKTMLPWSTMKLIGNMSGLSSRDRANRPTVDDLSNVQHVC